MARSMYRLAAAWVHGGSVCSAHLRCLGAASLALLAAHAGWAASRTVTTLSDGGAGSLRDAIVASVANDTIVFAVTGTIILTNELGIGRNLTIIGPATAPGITISGANSFRVFNIGGGAVNLSTLTITHGLDAGTNGANGNQFNHAGSAGGDGVGGGIYNSATLSLTNCLLLGNVVSGGTGGEAYLRYPGGAGGKAFGGAVYNAGTLNLINCTLANNSILGGSAGGGFDVIGAAGGVAYGGGVANQGALTLVNCTFSGNSATGGTGGQNYSGISGTEAGGRGGDAGGGGVFQAGSCNLLNTIFASDSTAGGVGGRGTVAGTNGTAYGPDIYGAVASQGHNLVGETNDCSGWVGGDLAGSVGFPLDPLLGPLTDNGGPTPTMALQATSAAIDGGDDSVLGSPWSLATDQRGAPRRYGAHVDIGAFEANPPLVFNNNDSGPWSLRALIQSNAPNGIIGFAPAVTGVITLYTGELDISNNVSILGPGAKTLAISGNGSGRVFNVLSGAVLIAGLEIAGGHYAYSDGGGGIQNSGSLTLSNCVVFGNSALNGGGIMNYGTLALWNSTIEQNTVSGASPDTSLGAGLYNYPGGTAVLRNCTLANNSCIGSGGNSGGGIYSYSATLLLTNCTISGNEATTAGGGVCNIGAGTVTLRDTLIAGNFGSVTAIDCSGAFNSGGYNLIGIAYGSTGLTNSVNHDQAGSLASPLNPGLGPLQDNGGPTPTMALLRTSPAVDQGGSSGLTTDQRGWPRSFAFPSMAEPGGGDGSDIGAFELVFPPLSIRHSGNSAVLSWPSYAANFRLESVTKLGLSNNWASVNGTPVLVGSSVYATNEAAGGSQFFRLIFP